MPTLQNPLFPLEPIEPAPTRKPEDDEAAFRRRWRDHYLAQHRATPSDRLVARKSELQRELRHPVHFADHPQTYWRRVEEFEAVASILTARNVRVCYR